MLTVIKGEILKPSEMEKFISITDTLPEVLHRYGDELPNLDKIYWMRYVTKREDSFISFSRNTYSDPLLKEIQETIASRLQSLFVDLIISPAKVQLMKTKGSIPPHVDEAKRNCSINIGVKNSDSAITKYSLIDAKSEIAYLRNTREYLCQDGYGVLLNTSSVHSVVGNPNVERILITYGFEASYEDVKSKLKE